MSTTPAWLTALTAVLAAVAGLGGILAGVLIEVQREKSARRREMDAWAAEAEAARRADELQSLRETQRRLAELQVFADRVRAHFERGISDIPDEVENAGPTLGGLGRPGLPRARYPPAAQGADT